MIGNYFGEVARVESPGDVEVDLQRALRNARLTFRQENRPQERHLGIIYISVAHELTQVSGEVPWRCPSFRWLRDSYYFGGAAENYDVKPFLKE